MTEKKKTLAEHIVNHYREIVRREYPDHLSAWPVLSGFNAKTGTYRGWYIVILNHTGNPNLYSFNGLGEIPQGTMGIEQLDEVTKEISRTKLRRHFNLNPTDAIVFYDPEEKLDDELTKMLQRHEFALGFVPMRIFLSHKGADKDIVREYKATLELLGFNPWLDEDAMLAGSELERAILQGFKESCAAVFFVTPNFRDEEYLASEVDYAIQQKRKKGDAFSIITLVFQDQAMNAKVPELLARYVWKEPSNDLEGLREIIRALPIQLGQVYWRR